MAVESQSKICWLATDRTWMGKDGTLRWFCKDSIIACSNIQKLFLSPMYFSSRYMNLIPPEIQFTQPGFTRMAPKPTHHLKLYKSYILVSSHWKRLTLNSYKDLWFDKSWTDWWLVGVGAAGTSAPWPALLALFRLLLGLLELVFAFAELLLAEPQLPSSVQFPKLVSRFGGVLVGFSVVMT